MSRPRANPFTSGLITAVVLLIVMTAIFMAGIPGGPQIPLPWSQKTTLYVQLADADALAPHASVEIGGVKVGEVESVAAKGNVAVATLQVQRQYADIRADATVYLRAHGLFGPKYIAIQPGTASAALVGDGGTIKRSQTVQPVDLDAVLQDLAKPEQQNLRTVIIEFGQAAAGRGSEFNHLLAAANSLTRVLDSPLKAADAVGPQLSDMLVNNEAFNAYFAQAPLDQLVANSEQTFRAFAANAGHLESLLKDANASLTTLDNALKGEPGNLAKTIQALGASGGAIDRLSKFTYLIALFGANLTGNEKTMGTDPASQDVIKGIVGAITNIASAFIYSDPCPVYPDTIPPPDAKTGLPSDRDGHCTDSPDGREHYLDTRIFNGLPANPCPANLEFGFPCNPGTVVSEELPAGRQLSSFTTLLAS
jgi:virulence factor Mce-like protein